MKKIKTKELLIIGSAGYIGSRLCNYLTHNNIKFETNDLKKNIKIKNIKHIKDDFENLKLNYIRKFRFILILAAHPSIAKCNNDPYGAIENNILNTRELLLKIKKANSKPIFVSTTAIYNGSKVPSKEDDKKFNYIPNQLYDISKFYIENFIIRIFKKYFILRLGTVSGYSPKIDKRLIVNSMYNNAIKNKKIMVTSKKSKKSLLFIDDFCRAIETIIISKQNKSGIFNLNSINASVDQIAKSISKISNAKIIYNKGRSFYSFFTSNKKFSHTYNFKFTNDLTTILNSFNK